MKLKIGKTEIEISYFLLCLVAISLILGVFRDALCAVLAIIIHESGHLLMMKWFGYFPERIKIASFEIVITDRKRQERRTSQNLLIIFFGPAANFICFLLLYLLYLLGIETLLPLAAANLSVGLFNLLPVMSLDGGQLLYLFLCRKHTPERSAQLVYRTTFLILLPTSALGFLVLFHSHYNFSLLFVCAYLIFALIVRQEKYD